MQLNSIDGSILDMRIESRLTQSDAEVFVWMHERGGVNACYQNFLATTKLRDSFSSTRQLE